MQKLGTKTKKEFQSQLNSNKRKKVNNMKQEAQPDNQKENILEKKTCEKYSQAFFLDLIKW